MPVARCPYETFGIPRDATHRAVTRAYVALTAALWARATSLSPAENARLAEYNVAWDILRHSERRAEWDSRNPSKEETGSGSAAGSKGGSASGSEGSGSGSAQGESGGTNGKTEGSAGGTASATEKASGSGGAADSDSGAKGKAGARASGIHTAPYPKSRRKEGPKPQGNHKHHKFGRRFSYQSRFTIFSYPVPSEDYSILRAMHAAANAPRPTLRRARHRLHDLHFG